MSTTTFPYQDTTLSFEERARDLVSRMTLEEKTAQMLHAAPAIERLGVAPHNWWNECLHGVARGGVATVFPQAIGLASMFDTGMMHRVAVAISDEARAKHHACAARGDFGIYKGLTYWTPNINIFRDPRWGRGQETYGECPYLTGETAKAFIRGLQGDDGKYLKLVATPKHYAVHSGPEENRHSFDAVVTDKDLWETYLPAFRATIVDGGAWSVMGAYNRTNGEPCCGSHTLLVDILRGRWGFEGYVVSDCGAIQDFHQHHQVTKTAEESAALAVRMGCDLNCGCMYTHLGDSVKQGLLAEADIDACVARLMEARMRLGMFDPPESVPYTSIPYEVIDSPEHRRLALEAARKSIVLLRNANGILPLSKEVKTIAVIGPNADDRRALLGNYHGIPTKAITPLEGIRGKVSSQTRVLYQPGSDLFGVENLAMGSADRYFAEACIAASRADVVVMCLGLNADMEGEQGDASNAEAAGDRVSLGLTKIQEKLLRTIVAEGTPVVLVLISGSGVSVPFAMENCAAVVQQFYPGEEGGTALADVLFGDCNPAGRMPVTVYTDIRQLPPFADYGMKGRTYRFLESDPLIPFGFGLSYSEFTYRDFAVEDEITTHGELHASVVVRNNGARSGDEVVQFYLARGDGNGPMLQLAGFRRVTLGPGESKKVEVTISPRQLAYVNGEGRCIVGACELRLYAGGAQPTLLSEKLGASPSVHKTVRIAGEDIVLPW